MSDKADFPPINRLDPLNYFLFEKMFGEKGDEPQLLSFLKPVLARTGRDLQDIEIVQDKTFTPETISDKKAVLDVRARMTDGTRCNIEVQRKDRFNFDKRSLYYWGREYVKGIKTGQDYLELPDVIVVNILDFNHFTLEDFHTSFHLYEDRHKDFLLTNAEEIHYIEIPKFRAIPEKDVHANPLHRWLTYMDIETPLPIIQEVIEMDPAIAKAQEVMDFISQNEAMFHVYEMHQLALSDEATALKSERREGRNEGRNEVIELMEKGYTVQQIKELLASQRAI
ncbi:MAG: Rpn family recombination-promoting nuclease/putative transposase [Treponema sp.]|jgi:predicted transposase/invertase (TIGR01784 family)|nr:Rpn family recombination-promoting nuclease/putative transposase [Treponema sp.]